MEGAYRFGAPIAIGQRVQQQPETELIALSKQGDQAAMAELFGRHYSSSLHLARSILRSEEASEDAVQVAYFSAFRHLHSFRGDASFKTWITRIVVNCCRSQLRELRRQMARFNPEDPSGGLGLDQIASSAPTPETVVWRQEIHSAFLGAVSRLPKSLRETYELHSISGLSSPEIAATLGLTAPATKTRLFRARARMRMDLSPIWPGARIGA
jgi:RNA polymerase sigma-70 factor, ECF subfamily